MDLHKWIKRGRNGNYLSKHKIFLNDLTLLKINWNWKTTVIYVKLKIDNKIKIKLKCSNYLEKLFKLLTSLSEKWRKRRQLRSHVLPLKVKSKFVNIVWATGLALPLTSYMIMDKLLKALKLSFLIEFGFKNCGTYIIFWFFYQI